MTATKLSLALVLASLCGCSSTTGFLVTEERDAWIDVRESGLSNVFYCRANPTPSGSAAPACYKPTFHDYADEKQSQNAR